MKDCLCKGQEYIVPDLDDPNMYYTLEKDKNGKVTFAHTEIGWMIPVFVEEVNGKEEASGHTITNHDWLGILAEYFDADIEADVISDEEMEERC